MQTIIILLDPSKLENPDLDLRYNIPDRIEEISDGRIEDNGYDYIETGGRDDILGIWLRTKSADKSYPVIIKLFQEEKFLGNDLSLSAEIYISGKESEKNLENCTKVFPGQIFNNINADIKPGIKFWDTIYKDSVPDILLFINQLNII